jgi:hypothetical protein
MPRKCIWILPVAVVLLGACPDFGEPGRGNSWAVEAQEPAPLGGAEQRRCFLIDLTMTNDAPITLRGSRFWVGYDVDSPTGAEVSIRLLEGATELASGVVSGLDEMLEVDAPVDVPLEFQTFLELELISDGSDVDGSAFAVVAWISHDSSVEAELAFSPEACP